MVMGPVLVLALFAALGGSPRCRTTAAPVVPRAQDAAATYYVDTDGSDTTGDGSLSHPWATITRALETVPDGSLILV